MLVQAMASSGCQGHGVYLAGIRAYQWETKE